MLSWINWANKLNPSPVDALRLCASFGHSHTDESKPSPISRSKLSCQDKAVRGSERMRERGKKSYLGQSNVACKMHGSIEWCIDVTLVWESNLSFNRDARSTWIKLAGPGVWLLSSLCFFSPPPPLPTTTGLHAVRWHGVLPLRLVPLGWAGSGMQEWGRYETRGVPSQRRGSVQVSMTAGYMLYH